MTTVIRRLAAAVLVAAVPANAAAGRYFRPGFDSAKVGLFNEIGGTRQEIGFVTPAVLHDKADGYWMIPGITWDLLDIGYSQEKLEDGSTRRAARFGPSVNLEEPVKAGLRILCRGLPGWTADKGTWTILRTALAEGPDGALAMGPSFRVDAPKLDVKTWRGGWDWALTLNKRFGGPQ